MAAVLAAGLVVSVEWLDETGGMSLLRLHLSRSVAAGLVVVLLTTVNLQLRWLRWAFLVRRHHVRIPTRDTVVLFFATLPAVLTPLYLGELVRVAIVSRRAPRAGPAMFWTWVLERVSDAGALLVLWGIAVGELAQAAGGALLLLSAPWLLAVRTLRRPEARGVHTASVGALSVVAACASLSLLAWVLPALGAWVALLAFSPESELAVAVGAFSRGTLLGGLSGIPAGTGVTGSATILHLIDHGVAAPAATAAVAVLRAATTWYAVALGCVILVVWRHQVAALLGKPHASHAHFDDLAESYANEIPAYLRGRLLERKLDPMLTRLAPAGLERPLSGLDIGCGQGWYAVELARRGQRMSGVDASSEQIARARAHANAAGVEVDLRIADAAELPFEAASFDFVYGINVLHHMASPAAQQDMLREILRVLKPGGQFFLHEMNVENALFRLYMSYVFPLVKNIDEGTELWIEPSRLPRVSGARWLPDVVYFTFLPDFLPERLLRGLAPLESWLERSALRRYSAHYMVTLSATPPPTPRA